MAQLLKNIQGYKPQIEILSKAKKNQHLPHALLFTGVADMNLIAWAFAQTLLCKKSDLACGICASCLRVERQSTDDILFIEPDGLYIKIEAIRKISQFLFYQSLSSGRIIIINSAHQMNLQASNSLLKMLEEPPPNVYFILISSNVSSILQTVRSRVQTFRFFSLPVSENLEEFWVRASYGNQDSLEKWKENKQLRIQAFELLQKAVIGEELCSFEELANRVKKRESALFVCLCWQQILRDTCMLKLNSKDIVIHQDQQDIFHTLKKVPLFMLDIFFQETIELEQDLKGYLDSVLAFDNFCMQIKKRTQNLHIGKNHVE